MVIGLVFFSNARLDFYQQTKMRLLGKRRARPSSTLVITTQPIVKPTTVKAYPLRISNVVCTAWAGKSLDLRLVQLASSGRLDETVFPSSVSRARNPETTNSIFDTGRILITGASSPEAALYAAIRFIDKLNRSLFEDLSVFNFKVQNIVSSFSLGYHLNIDMFYSDQKTTAQGTAHYEPSLFRGCSWKPMNGLVFVLFLSGRVVLTGARSWEEALASYNEALPILARYKVGNEYKAFDEGYRRTRMVDVHTKKKVKRIKNE
jgi:transcription initiation factor TFIID TATA-box-binding protein